MVPLAALSEVEWWPVTSRGDRREGMMLELIL
jgi:hypothetical protein